MTKPTHPMIRITVVSLVFTSITSFANEVLQEVQKLTLPELRSATSIVLTKDGRAAITASFNAQTVATFKRDPGTGLLDLTEAVTSDALHTVVAVALSPDEKLVAASAFGTDTVTLFTRDPESGRLSVSDSVKEGEDGRQGLDFVVEARFSPKGDFLYTGSAKGMGVYEVKDGKLEMVQYEAGDGKLDGIRGITLSPRGDWIYVASARSGTLSVLRRNASTGTVQLHQVLSNSDAGTSCLKGVFRCCTSADGRHVYVSSGRFGGDHAVAAFEAKPDGRLSFVQEFVDGSGEFKDFKGGNSLAVSPDGKWLFALATVSDRLFRFRRDALTGRLTFVASQQVGNLASPGSASVCFSPDGTFAYIADEAAGAIVTYRLID